MHWWQLRLHCWMTYLGKSKYNLTDEFEKYTLASVMYLSRLIISNYRSIKELALKFEKGKNVIVGKNNAGKSNIIRAIDLLLGENSPSWAKSENITENDFYNGNFEAPIFIFCELAREPEEALNYDEIYKCFGFKYHARITEWVNGKPIKVPERHTLPGNSIYDFLGNLDAVMNIGEDDEGIATNYVNPKLRHQGTFEAQFDDKFIFAFAFRAFLRPNGKIHKEIRFFYRENRNTPWVMAFSAPVRNELLQSAIIHSFRDPQNELRINQWSWFGKLLKTYINPNDAGLVSAFQQLKAASNGVFEGLQQEINNQKIKVAFPNTTISFQFNPDTRIDVYKSALIYVDDGFVSLLQEKGSGIQSAVIIGLFNYYTTYVSHTSSSLLAVEEPEIYLHPQARRVISHRIDDFLQGNRNQVIITTHSTEFITSAHENLNIIVVNKTSEKGTTAHNAKFESSKEKQILVKLQNAEMFFADMVILVEGGEKYVFESVAKFYGGVMHKHLGDNWLNENNISVIAVGGKSEFGKYVKKLTELGIPAIVLADFDFFLRQLPEFYTETGVSKEKIDELNKVKSQIGESNPHLPRQIIQQIEVFNTAITELGLSVNAKALRNYIKEPFRLKRLEQLSETKRNIVRPYLEALRKDNIFVLTGELEDFYTDICKERLKRISGKEEKPIHIVSRLVSDHEPITTFVKSEEYFAVLDTLVRKLSETAVEAANAVQSRPSSQADEPDSPIYPKPERARGKAQSSQASPAVQAEEPTPEVNPKVADQTRETIQPLQPPLPRKPSETPTIARDDEASPEGQAPIG